MQRWLRGINGVIVTMHIVSYFFFYTIQNLNDKRILNKTANTIDKELNKS